MTGDTTSDTGLDDYDELYDGEIKLSAEEEIEAAIAHSEIKEKKKKLKKKRMKIGMVVCGILFLSYVTYELFKPYEGTMLYGICKIFLELNVRYPESLRLSTVEELGTSVRIWYTQLDSFGEYRMEPIECFYRQEEDMSVTLDKVTIRRREVDPQRVESFNKVFQVMMAHPPDLTYPDELPDSLEGLQFDVNRFRKPIF